MVNLLNSDFLEVDMIPDSSNSCRRPGQKEYDVSPLAEGGSLERIEMAVWHVDVDGREDRIG